MTFIKDKNGYTHKIDEYGYDDGIATISIDNYKITHLKAYYRHERTWDDHMGNTPCGYYVLLPLPLGDGKVEWKRYYLQFK